jgi:hypothetical protein
MGGVVVVVAQCGNGAGGSDAAGFSFFPSSGPAPVTRCDSANATIAARPPAPPPSEGLLSPSAATPIAMGAGEAAVGRGAAVDAAQAT